MPDLLRPSTLDLPASSLTDEQLAAEEAWLDKEWEDLRTALEESGGFSGSPGEWIWERSGEIETVRLRRAAAQVPSQSGEGSR